MIRDFSKFSLWSLTLGASLASTSGAHALAEVLDESCAVPAFDSPSPTAPLAAVDPDSFARKSVKLDNGLVGRLLKFESSTPQDFGPMLAGKLGPTVTLDAQFFKPSTKKRSPAIVMVPGSGNIGPHHLEQVSTLTSAGIAVLLIDPFRAREISSTIENQAQLSWAASTYDVIAAVEFLKTVEGIDLDNIGAVGSSRGGTAVQMAMTDQVSGTLLKKGERIKAGFSGYPWCGLQFWNASVSQGSSLLIMSGSKDDWVSVQQCQDFAHATVQQNANIRMTLVPGAYHAFDRSGTAPHRIENVFTSPSYPTVYMSDAGTYMDPVTGLPDETITADDFLDDAVQSGFVRKGVTIGTCGSQAKDYRDAMVRFFSEAFTFSEGKSHE